MYGPRSHFLAGSGFRLQQHVAVHHRHFLDGGECGLHAGACADEFGNQIISSQSNPQTSVLPAKQDLFPRAFGQGADIMQSERFGNIVERTDLLLGLFNQCRISPLGESSLSIIRWTPFITL